MAERADQIRRFLADAGWHKAELAALAGDASNRRYLRVTHPEDGLRAVLMDAPAEKGEDTRPFIRIATWLSASGFSAPAILHSDPEAGLLLLEDLGDDLFARVLRDSAKLENRLYSCATDVLVALHGCAPPDDLSPYSVPVMTELAALAHDWYLAHTREPDPDARADFVTEMSDVLHRHAPEQTVLIQRDYHSENLLWLPEREGVARVGLLDFQDAALGHRAYDLVSLLQDARRDVSPAIEAEMIRHYCTATGQDHDRFNTAYHALGAQRNLRILGVFARLCLRDGKAHYVDLIPRVWGLLERDLRHPALGAMAHLVNSRFPAPDAPLLERLKTRCATVPAH